MHLYSYFTDSDTLFRPHQRPANRLAFESVNFNGEYLVMNENGTLSLGSRDIEGTIYEFTRIPAGKSSRYVYLIATVSSGDTCYISFDGSGTSLANQCVPLSGVGMEHAKVQVN